MAPMGIEFYTLCCPFGMDDCGTEFPSSALPSSTSTCSLEIGCSQQMELLKQLSIAYLLDQVPNELSLIASLPLDMLQTCLLTLVVQ